MKVLGRIILPRTLQGWKSDMDFDPIEIPGKAEALRAEKIRDYWAARGITVDLELSSYQLDGHAYRTWFTKSNIVEKVCGQKSTK